MAGENGRIDGAAGAAIRIPRRRFLVGAGSGVASGIALTTPAAAQAPIGRVESPARVADIILKGGKVITVDPAFTIASAIAIGGDRILAVGPDEAMAAHAGPRTRIINLNGRAVIPGITDGHAHMDREGLRNVFPSLGRVRSIGDIQDRIAELARGKAPGEWIVTMPIGEPPHYFDVPDILAEKRWPTRRELDVAAPRNPVFIRSIWGYWRGAGPLVSIANTEALRLVGITGATVSPAPTLVIEKDAGGDPTGVFIEHEMAPIAELIWFRRAASFSHADRVKALPESARAYHAFATTSVFEGHGAGSELLRVYKDCLRWQPDHARDACIQRRLEGGGGSGAGAYRLGGVQCEPWPAARPGEEAARPLCQERYSRRHDRLGQSRPLRRS